MQRQQLTIFAPPGEFFKAKTALLQAFPETELEVQEITFLPRATRARCGRPGDVPEVHQYAERMR